MNNEEAKAKIMSEFMDRYYQWMEDRFDLDDNDYGRKYGWQKSEKLMKLKDNLTAVTMFQKYIFSGKTESGWNKSGIDSRTVWSLACEGWLSRSEGHYRRPTFYYISQQRAKEIYKHCEKPKLP